MGIASPEQTFESYDLNARRLVAKGDRGLSEPIKYLKNYSYPFRERRTRPDRPVPRAEQGVTLVSCGMVDGARAVSGSLAGLSYEQLSEALDYSLTIEPIEVAVRGLAILGKGKPTATVKGDKLEEEMEKLRDTLAAFIPDRTDRTAWLRRYRNTLPHVTIASLDMRVPPSDEMMDGIAGKLPKTVQLTPPTYGPVQHIRHW